MENSNDSFIHPEEFWKSVGVRAKQVIVHLGCGAGYYIIPAARMVGPEGKAIGIDVIPDMLREVESRAKREHVQDTVVTVRANVENPNGSTLEPLCADWVLLTNIVHQSDRQKIFIEAERITSPHGHVIVVGWDVTSSPFGPPQEKRMSQDEVQVLASKVGLVKERLMVPSRYHYSLVFSKKKE